MQITKISLSQPSNPQFKAVNQKYFEWAKKDFSIGDSVSTEWMDRLSFDVFLFKKISRQDAIDTINAVKRYMKKTTEGLEETLKSLKESINLEWTYNSNGIEGNTLTLRETQVVLEGITVGGKSLKEHLEAINHEQAILFLDDLIKDKEPVTEWNIKNIHQLVLKEIDDDNAGKYRDENVKIKGATHTPPDYLIVPELMEKLIINYEDWKKYHPIIRAALLHGELVKIHPFVDGNGRTSRLVMNLSLMNSGYLPVIVKKEKRLEYYNALDKAHTTGNYTDFVKLVNELEIEMLNKYLELL